MRVLPASSPRTGLPLPSALGIGLAALGRPGYINLGHADDLAHDYDVEAMRARAHRVLDRAWELGIRYYDAARSYGRAEDFLGTWLPGHDGAVVGSKWGYIYTADWSTEADQHEVKDHTLATLQRQREESRQTLGDRLNLYQIHSATLESGVLERADVLAELVRLRRDEGLAVGLSLSGPRQAETLDRALTVQADGERVFDCVQATWNILEPSVGEALAAAHELGLNVVVKEGLANGRLTARNQDPRLGPRLAELAASCNATIDALSLAACLAQSWADVVLSGAASVDHLESNFQALQVDPARLPREELRSLCEDPQDYWAIRSRLAWN